MTRRNVRGSTSRRSGALRKRKITSHELHAMQLLRRCGEVTEICCSTASMSYSWMRLADTRITYSVLRIGMLFLKARYKEWEQLRVRDVGE
jgi:hypothetical protein